MQNVNRFWEDISMLSDTVKFIKKINLLSLLYSLRNLQFFKTAILKNNSKQLLLY